MAAAADKRRAELKTGQLLREQPKAKGGERGGRKDKKGGRSVRPSNEIPKTLEELNISKTQASRWQEMARP